MVAAQRITDPCTVPGSEFTSACTNAPGPTGLDLCKLPNGSYDVTCSSAYLAKQRPTAATSPAADNSLNLFIGLALLLVLLWLYFLPSAVANRREARHRSAILLVNFVLGWTLIGWFCALLWALVDPSLRGTIPCPYCAETIKAAARICPHCRHDLTPVELKPA